ncbi:MAG: hypothetical protein KC931_01770 [Candidatus Omnitrophica bacterium]|nr:hypothetical protein [Candidatus Omnitrophota bacterium]
MGATDFRFYSIVFFILFSQNQHLSEASATDGTAANLPPISLKDCSPKSPSLVTSYSLLFYDPELGEIRLVKLGKEPEMLSSGVKVLNGVFSPSMQRAAIMTVPLEDGEARSAGKHLQILILFINPKEELNEPLLVSDLLPNSDEIILDLEQPNDTWNLVGDLKSRFLHFPALEWSPSGDRLLVRVVTSEPSSNDKNLSFFLWEPGASKMDLVLKKEPEVFGGMLWAKSGDRFCIQSDPFDESRECIWYDLTGNLLSRTEIQDPLNGHDIQLNWFGAIPDDATRNQTISIHNPLSRQEVLSPDGNRFITSIEGSVYIGDTAAIKDKQMGPLGSDRDRNRLKSGLRLLVDHDGMYWPDLGYLGIKDMWWTPDSRHILLEYRKEFFLIDPSVSSCQTVFDEGVFLGFVRNSD